MALFAGWVAFPLLKTAGFAGLVASAAATTALATSTVPPVPMAKPYAANPANPPVPGEKPLLSKSDTSTPVRTVVPTRAAMPIVLDEGEDSILSALGHTPPLDLESEAPARRRVAIGRGDTLVKLMVREGVDRRIAHQAAVAIGKVHDPRRLRPGQNVTMVFRRDASGKPRLSNVRLDANVERSVVAHRRDDGGFQGEAIDHPLVADALAHRGRIDGSLFQAANAQGVPAKVTIELIKLFSFDVDFQRDIQPGDGFRLLYQAYRDANGDLAKTGDILFAELQVAGKTLPLYRFEMKDGSVEYFNDKGESVRKALLKTPVDGARLSSRFGRRRHPVLGYTKMHRGVDFAAPRGTPVVAAGDGKIEHAGRKGAYGKYIRIRHNSDFKTAYAHLRAYARGIRSGRRVRQGQVIGYVGSTGRSTGAHLHYEVLRGNRQVNPLGLKLPTGRKLNGKAKRRFFAARSELDQRYSAAIAAPVRLAAE